MATAFRITPAASTPAPRHEDIAAATALTMGQQMLKTLIDEGPDGLRELIFRTSFRAQLWMAEAGIDGAQDIIERQAGF